MKNQAKTIVIAAHTLREGDNIALACEGDDELKFCPVWKVSRTPDGSVFVYYQPDPDGAKVIMFPEQFPVIVKSALSY